MANKTVYPYGTGGSLPSSIGIINDLSTGGTTDALAAEQGKVIGDYLFGNYQSIDTSGITKSDFSLGANTTSSNHWTNASAKHFVIPVNPGDQMKLVKTGGTGSGPYGFLSAGYVVPAAASSLVTYAPSCERQFNSGTIEVVVPNGAAYLCLCTVDGSGLTTSWGVYRMVRGIDNDFASDGQLNEIGEKIDEIYGDIGEMCDYDNDIFESTNTSKITVTKVEPNSYLVKNISKTQSVYTLYHLPPLTPETKYRVEFDYDAVIIDANTWYLGVEGATYSATARTGYSIPNGNGHIVWNLTAKSGDMYFRLTSNGVGSGSVVKITNLSITEYKTTIGNLAREVASLKEEDSGNNLTALLRQARYVSASPTTQPLTLLHFSDIHGDNLAATKIKKVFSDNSSMIDDMLLTGDTVYYYYNDSGQGYQWHQDTLSDALFVLGNHDGAANDNSHGWKEGSADWDFKGKEWDYDTYFANYVSGWGVTQPTGVDDSESANYKACFWYKDYASAKIRLIGLDCMHFNDGVRHVTDEQETWLTETLAAAKVLGYGVVVACHYPMDDYNGELDEEWDETTHKFVYNNNSNGGTIVDSHTGDMTTFQSSKSALTLDAKFCMRDRIAGSSQTAYTRGPNNPLGDIIQTWVDGGGQFIVWLCGHTHLDYLYYPKRFPGLLCMGISQAGNTRGTNVADRSDSSEMHTCANLVTIDVETGYLKVIRIGFTMDKRFRSSTLLSYSLTAKKVQANS